MQQLISGDEAVECKTQPITPCSDCPFARTALKGWLGNMDIDEWLQALHGEAKIDCHALIGPQCAGAAIYRANVCKLTRDQSILRLPPNRKLCFGTPKEFREHHSKMNVDELV